MQGEIIISKQVQESADWCFTILKKAGHFTDCNGAWEKQQIAMAIHHQIVDQQTELIRLRTGMNILTSKKPTSVLKSDLNTAHNQITALNIRITMRNELINGYFAKHIEDCKRTMRKFKTNTPEYNFSHNVMNRLIDIKNEILKC